MASLVTRLESRLSVRAGNVLFPLLTPEGKKRLSVREALIRTLGRETVSFSVDSPDLCIDGRPRRFDDDTIKNSEKKGIVENALDRKNIGEYHFPAGDYGLFLYPLLQSFEAVTHVQMTEEQATKVNDAIHSVFTKHKLPFIWHNDTSDHRGCAAIELAGKGTIKGLEGKNIHAAKLADKVMQEHHDTVALKYIGGHDERAVLVNTSSKYTLDDSPDGEGNQWFICDINASMRKIFSLMPEIYGQLSVDILSTLSQKKMDEKKFTTFVANTALDFGVGVLRTLAESKHLPSYMLHEDKKGMLQPHYFDTYDSILRTVREEFGLSRSDTRRRRARRADANLV